MTPAQRIRLARRHGGLSQAALARAVGVQRSAVSHWEGSNAKSPSTSHLCEIATATAVNFEWLATGRGTMALSRDVALDSVAPAHALLVEEPIELRLLQAFRNAARQSRLALVEIAEQLATHRTGRVPGKRLHAVATTDPEKNGDPAPGHGWDIGVLPN